MAVSERTIKDRIVAALRARGAYVVVTTGVSDAGTPDILACYRGRFYGFEVKNDVGRASKIQMHRIQQIENAGGVAVVVRGAAPVEALLDEMLEREDA